MVRSILFQGAYWLTSVFFALTALPLFLAPGRSAIVTWINIYTKVMVFWMRWIAGVKIIVRGREKLPQGAYILAAKHQSWGDGLVMFSIFKDLAVVIGDHIERFPIVGDILRKMGAIIVNNCGGPVARMQLIDKELDRVKKSNRRILIYPEGHLSPVGRRHRYRRGVFYMYKKYDRPVVPVATNLGLRWPQQSWRLTPGEAVIEFLDPIAPGADKDRFMVELERAIETRSLELLGPEKSRMFQGLEHLPDPEPIR